ncbi:hypothetical protein DM01DRAFT_1115507 [Hesseltinella vesiculosa]|uniref:Uncharacterized protein n=1 Tax=Hesseltinella vesiculosa TaxID=101127 RepID=A0A1X2G9C4_9FUNG|nr:hypothetical protein DM01DRAFT_1115507 [Hesseltinella vesiculosa]
MMMILKKSRRLIKIAQPTFGHFCFHSSDPPAKKNEGIAHFCQGVLSDLRKCKKKNGVQSLDNIHLLAVQFRTSLIVNR